MQQLGVLEMVEMAYKVDPGLRVTTAHWLKNIQKKNYRQHGMFLCKEAKVIPRYFTKHLCSKTF
jgi:hypothetical protein